MKWSHNGLNAYMYSCMKFWIYFDGKLRTSWPFKVLSEMCMRLGGKILSLSCHTYPYQETANTNIYIKKLSLYKLPNKTILLVEKKNIYTNPNCVFPLHWVDLKHELGPTQTRNFEAEARKIIKSNNNTSINIWTLFDRWRWS